jgi:hypothetical protein
VRQRLSAIVVAASFVTAAVPLVAIRPATADTACADLWAQHSGGPPTYVPGPGPGNCVPTPFTRIYHDDSGVRVTQTGTPCDPYCEVGYWVDVTAPV